MRHSTLLGLGIDPCVEDSKSMLCRWHGHDIWCALPDRSSRTARTPLENLDNNSELPRPAPVNGQRSGELGLPPFMYLFEHMDGEFTPATDGA